MAQLPRARRSGPPARTRPSRRWLAAVLAGTVAAAAAVAWVLWSRPAPAPQARQYLNATACLLTSPTGIVPGTAAAPVWTALRSASLSTHVMVSYLPATSAADRPAMLNSLVERRCGVIVATGADTAPVVRAARAHPRQRFLLVTASGMHAPGNLAVVAPGAARASVDQALQTLAAHATALPS